MKTLMSHKKQWIYKPRKQGGRKFFMNTLPKAVKVYFTFCGINSLDIKLAIEMGVIDDNTLIIVVEREPTAVKEIENYLKQLPNEYYIHRKNLRYFHNIGEVLNGKKIDSAFFDFCGVVDEHSTRWIVNNSHHFAEGCCFGYTVSSNFRVAPFLYGFRDSFLSKQGIKPFCKRAMANIRHSVCPNDYAYDDVKRQVVMNRRNANVWLSCQIISLMFGVKIELSNIYSYRDTKHGMNIIIGKIVGQVRQKAAIKFASYMEAIRNKPRRRIVKEKVITPQDTLRQFIRQLAQNAIKNSGKIQVTGGQKARMTKLAHDAEKSVVHCWSGVKILVKKNTGKSATMVTIPNRKH
jgi:hypothetical protein